MKGCATCKHVGGHIDNPPCIDECRTIDNYTLWEASDQVKELISEAKKEAFEAGFHKGLEMIYKDYIDVENEYNQWKEAK